MAYIVPIISDTHIGSTLGLLHPDGATTDDGATVSPSKTQQWLYARYTDYLASVKQLTKRQDKIIGVLNGDAVDVIEKSSQLWTKNDMDAVRAATQVLSPLRELCRDGFFVVRGTEAHTRPAGQVEEALGMALNATHWPEDAATFSTYHIELCLGGIGLDCTHHGRTGRLEWTRMNASGGAAIELCLHYQRRGATPPRLAIRSHTHLYSDSGDNYPIRMITTPCWQMMTSYGHKVAPGKLPDIGGMILRIDTGEVEVKCLRYQPSAAQPWTL